MQLYTKCIETHAVVYEMYWNACSCIRNVLKL